LLAAPILEHWEGVKCLAAFYTYLDDTIGRQRGTVKSNLDSGNSFALCLLIIAGHDCFPGSFIFNESDITLRR
jgi:hypothetical protein